MTPEQRTALENPCYLAAETVHQRYGFGSRVARRVAVVLTVNAGYE